MPFWFNSGHFQFLRNEFNVCLHWWFTYLFWKLISTFETFGRRFRSNGSSLVLCQSKKMLICCCKRGQLFGPMLLVTEKAKHLNNYPFAVTINNLESFIGAVNYFWRFQIEVNCGSSKQLSWIPLINYFHKICSAIINATLLKLPDRHQQFTLQTDVSDYGFEATLSANIAYAIRLFKTAWFKTGKLSPTIVLLELKPLFLIG